MKVQVTKCKIWTFTFGSLLKEICEVPYRFLYPFFEDKLKDQKEVQKNIEEFSS